MLQTAAWTNPNKDAIWTASWESLGDAKFLPASPTDGDFYITASGHLSTDRATALMSMPPLDGIPWDLTAKISQPLAASQVIAVTFVRCEPDGSFCAPVAGWQGGLSGANTSDSWPHCTQTMKLSGGCVEINQGVEGVASRLRYTPKIRISTLGQPVAFGPISVSLSERANSK
jgi:hypothetical protein